MLALTADHIMMDEHAIRQVRELMVELTEPRLGTDKLRGMGLDVNCGLFTDAPVSPAGGPKAVRAVRAGACTDPRPPTAAF